MVAARRGRSPTGLPPLPPLPLISWSLDEVVRRPSGHLNSHSPASLYEAFPPGKTKALWDRFEFVPKSKHGSWLTMAGIAINAMVRPSA